MSTKMQNVYFLLLFIADQPSKRVEVNQRLQYKVGPELFEKMGTTTIGDPYKDSFRAQQLYLK